MLPYVLRSAPFAKGAFAPPLAQAREAPIIPAMPTRSGRMADLLRQHFDPTALRIADDSSRHAGHSGARPEGETHYSVLLVSPRFAGMNRVARSRLVHEVLATEFAAGLHALALTLRSPEEHAAAGATRS